VNIRGLQAIGNEIWSTYTSTTNGYEAELTANLTSAWRLTLNVSTNDSKQKDPYPEVPGFIASNEPILRQVLADAGVLIDADAVESWTREIVRLLEDEAHHADLVARGHARAAQFSAVASAEALLAAYREVLSTS